MEKIIFFVLIITIIAVVYIKKILKDRKAAEEERIFKETVRLDKEKRKNEAEHEKKIYEEHLLKEHKQASKKREEFLNQKRAEFKSVVDNIPLCEIQLSDEKHNRNPEIIIVDKEYKNITKSTPINKIKDFIAIDTETTGLKTGGNDIIQLSAIKFKNFQPISAFNTYIKPRKSIPKEATDINGITDDMVETAPRFYQIINSFNGFIEDLPLVAHNAPFDIKHLYVNGLDSIENKIVYDTLSLCRRTYKDYYSYKLADICELNNIYICNAHNSLYDCYAAGELFKCIIEDRKEIDIAALMTTE